MNLLYSSLGLPETGINKKGRNVKEIYLRNSVRFPNLFVKLWTSIANNFLSSSFSEVEYHRESHLLDLGFVIFL